MWRYVRAANPLGAPRYGVPAYPAMHRRPRLQPSQLSPGRQQATSKLAAPPVRARRTSTHASGRGANSAAPGTVRGKNYKNSSTTGGRGQTQSEQGSSGGNNGPLSLSPFLKVLGVSAGLAFLTLAGGVLSFPFVDAVVFPWAFERALRLSGEADARHVPPALADSRLRLPEARGLALAALGAPIGSVGDAATLEHAPTADDPRSGRVLIVTGAGGAGKSTVARRYLANGRPCIYVNSRMMLGEAATLYAMLRQVLQPLTIIGPPLVAYIKCANMLADMWVMNQDHTHNSIIFLLQFLGCIHVTLERMHRRRPAGAPVPVLVWDDIDHLVARAEESDTSRALLETVVMLSFFVAHDLHLCNVVFLGSDSLLAPSAHPPAPAAAPSQAELGSGRRGGGSATSGGAARDRHAHGDGAPAAVVATTRMVGGLGGTRFAELLPTVAARARFYHFSSSIRTADAAAAFAVASAPTPEAAAGSAEAAADAASTSTLAADAAAVVEAGGGASSLARDMLQCLTRAAGAGHAGGAGNREQGGGVDAAARRCIARGRVMATILSRDGETRIRAAMAEPGCAPVTSRRVLHLLRLAHRADAALTPADAVQSCPCARSVSVSGSGWGSGSGLAEHPAGAPPACQGLRGRGPAEHHARAGPSAGEVLDELLRLERHGVVRRVAGLNARRGGEEAHCVGVGTSTDLPVRLGFVLTAAAAAALGTVAGASTDRSGASQGAGCSSCSASEATDAGAGAGAVAASVANRPVSLRVDVMLDRHARRGSNATRSAAAHRRVVVPVQVSLREATLPELRRGLRAALCGDSTVTGSNPGQPGAPPQSMAAARRRPTARELGLDKEFAIFQRVTASDGSQAVAEVRNDLDVAALRQDAVLELGE